ncbi:MAG: sugar phosphate nucleotidyltransferase [Patescibacteria group bacterium]
MLIVILTGGVGKRLWPLGRKNNPKQFFPIITDQPLIKETYDRFAGHYPKNKIFFSTTPDLLKYLKRLFPRVPASQFIVEPARRDTGPAMGFAAVSLFLRQPDEPMVFVPADHNVLDIKKYLNCFKVGEDLIKKTGKLLDIGLAAGFPSTVLGYTRIGKKYGHFNGVEVYHFEGHTEKPELKVAEKYLASGDYLWHGNYYMWTPRAFLAAFAQYAPKLSGSLEKMKELLSKKRTAEIKKIYNQMEKISFDYAVTEKIKKSDVLIIKGDFGWGDVGAWDVLHQQLKHKADERGNVIQGEVISVDTKNCLLYSKKKKLMATLGVENLVVVDTDDALLICSRDRAQEVKKLIEEMERQGKDRYL